MLADSGLVHDAFHPEAAWLPLTRLPLPHKPEAVFRARRHAREVLSARRVESDVVASVELAVSELVTNAVRHGVCPCGCTRGSVSLALITAGERLRVEVGDPSRTPPCWPTGIEAVDEEALDGRGLLLVTGLAADWGDYLRGRRGKIVWCEFAPVPQLSLGPPPVAGSGSSTAGAGIRGLPDPGADRGGLRDPGSDPRRLPGPAADGRGLAGPPTGERGLPAPGSGPGGLTGPVRSGPDSRLPVPRPEGPC